MNALYAFVVWLETEGFVRQARPEPRAVQFLGDPDYRVSLKHPNLGWAHVSQYTRGIRVVVECVLYPEVLGARTVHVTLAGASGRLAVIRARAEQGPGKVWSEKKGVTI